MSRPSSNVLGITVKNLVEWWPLYTETALDAVRRGCGRAAFGDADISGHFEHLGLVEERGGDWTLTQAGSRLLDSLEVQDALRSLGGDDAP